MIRPLALAMALLATPAAALDVTHDLGGPVDARITEIEALRQSGQPVRILGLCVSACTMYLGLPQVCVARDAVLGFHGPQTAIGLPLPFDEFQRVSRAIANHYPQHLRAWYMLRARQRTEGHYSVSGAELIRLGARECLIQGDR